jgi:riboflavin synthase alpha subunit
MLNENLPMITTLSRRDKKKAQDYLAMKTREKFQSYIEKTKPTRVLSNTKNGPSVGGNGVTTTVTQEKDNEALDFVTQIRNMRG